jgi:hypothetical protein
VLLHLHFLLVPKLILLLLAPQLTIITSFRSNTQCRVATKPHMTHLQHEVATARTEQRGAASRHVGDYNALGVVDDNSWSAGLGVAVVEWWWLGLGLGGGA